MSRNNRHSNWWSSLLSIFFYFFFPGVVCPVAMVASLSTCHIHSTSIQSLPNAFKISNSYTTQCCQLQIESALHKCLSKFEKWLCDESFCMSKIVQVGNTDSKELWQRERQTIWRKIREVLLLPNFSQIAVKLWKWVENRGRRRILSKITRSFIYSTLHWRCKIIKFISSSKF